MGEKKKCFVVTPIGNDNTDIRRHIDGIIDQAIKPALEDKFEIEVAHRKYEIGSINDRIINSIHQADLVIANLTTLNPNVMFELAMRYSFGKPVIVIAEKGTKLPFDIIDENTIFYINDPAGAADLKDTLSKFEGNIDYSRSDYGPIYSALKKVSILEKVKEGVEDPELGLGFIMKRLDQIERKIDRDSEQRLSGTIRITESNDSPIGSLISKYNNEMTSDEIIRYYESLRNNLRHHLKDDSKEER